MGSIIGYFQRRVCQYLWIDALSFREEGLSCENKWLEAEILAFVVGFPFNLADLVSQKYLALWNANETKILACTDGISIIANKIINIIEPLTYPSEE
jgi:hypothetical protein